MKNVVVEKYFKDRDLPHKVIYLDESSATVPLAAEALGVEEAMIAKTLAFKLKDRNIVLVTCGTTRVDNKKYKKAFGCKAKMIPADETLEVTGYPVGGVCPFALPDEVDIYLDESLKNFETVYPAAGSANSAVKIAPEEMLEITGAEWVDVCS
ncbi:MAG: YbaK/EbsC family protein [Natronincolaceae bacterium]|jgi:Cys-tRNA(Pro) deacylase|nr:YbaK/EbsC family protein [Bacillota bacterium]NLK91495.1 YbaK/EbsC family protein [Clostridiales bacterium]